jgi:exportin-T
VVDELFTPLSIHVTGIMAQPVTGTDDVLSHGETKRTYATFLTNLMSSKIQGVFLTERTVHLIPIKCLIMLTLSASSGNKGQFEPVLQSMLELAEDVLDPQCQKVAFTFLNRSVSNWGQPVNEQVANNGDVTSVSSVPGYERFIYDNIVPSAFRVLSSPQLNIKDGQVLVVSLMSFHCRASC